MPRRVGPVLLALLLLIQAGPLCACAVDHALLCGGPHETPLAVADGQPNHHTSCGDPRCGVSCDTCPRHHHGAGCGRRDVAGSRLKLSSAIAFPLAVRVAPLMGSEPSSPQHFLHEVVPTPSPGTKLSLPLLN